jgi:hypothetical protein
VHVTSAIGAVTSIGMAIAVAIYLRDSRPSCKESSAGEGEPECVLAV